MYILLAIITTSALIGFGWIADRRSFADKQSRLLRYVKALLLAVHTDCNGFDLVHAAAAEGIPLLLAMELFLAAPAGLAEVPEKILDPDFKDIEAGI